MSIIVDKEFESLIPPLTAEEFRDMLRAIRIMPDEAVIKFIREGTG